MTVTPDDIERAADRIREHVHATPMMSSSALDMKFGKKIVFKCEHLQRTGSFKVRGAFNAALLHRDVPGYVAVSSGNHGAAVALAARSVGLPATILMPEDSSPVKREAVEAYGAAIVSDGITPLNREAKLAEYRTAHDLYLIHPYDDEDVIAGQGTIGLELLDDPSSFDAVLVAVGGGGLVSGIATAIHARRPGIEVIGVEPAAADDAFQSLRDGVIRELVAPPDTIADAVRTPHLGTKTFPLIQKHVTRILRIEEADIRAAHALLLSRTKQLVEPTAALAFSPLLTGADLPRKLCVLLCGGNWMPAL